MHKATERFWQHCQMLMNVSSIHRSPSTKRPSVVDTMAKQHNDECCEYPPTAIHRATERVGHHVLTLLRMFRESTERHPHNGRTSLTPMSKRWRTFSLVHSLCLFACCIKYSFPSGIYSDSQQQATNIIWWSRIFRFVNKRDICILARWPFIFI